MELKMLEADLLGDLAQDRHNLWEVFAFARLHSTDQTDLGVHSLALDLLTRWVDNGWLLVDAEATGGDLTIEDAPNAARTIPVINGKWEGPEILLALTDTAFGDVDWLRK